MKATMLNVQNLVMKLLATNTDDGSKVEVAEDEDAKLAKPEDGKWREDNEEFKEQPWSKYSYFTYYSTTGMKAWVWAFPRDSHFLGCHESWT